MGLADRLADLGPRPPRILTLDIETSPALVYTFDLKTDYISPDHVVQPSRVLCFAAKWHDEDRVQFYSEWGDEDMIDAAWRLLDEADIVIGYNHVRFDIPHLQREMVTAGYRPPRPWQDVDLLPAIRRRFRFMSNKLGYITQALGLDLKLDPGGFKTWQGVLDGDEKARRTMDRYCRGDVRITEDLFTYLRPWLSLPHAGLFTGRMSGCAACGSDRLVPDGIHRTRTAAWLRLECRDCHAINRLMVNGETRLA